MTVAVDGKTKLYGSGSGPQFTQIGSMFVIMCRRASANPRLRSVTKSVSLIVVSDWRSRSDPVPASGSVRLGFTGAGLRPKAIATA